MKKNIKKTVWNIVWFLMISCAIGGFTFLKAIFSAWWQLIEISFPVIWSYFIESVLTSPSFIVGIILFLLSLLGVYLSHRTEKKLYKVVSFVMGFVGIISTLTSFL